MYGSRDSNLLQGLEIFILNNIPLSKREKERESSILINVLEHVSYGWR